MLALSAQKAELSWTRERESSESEKEKGNKEKGNPHAAKRAGKAAEHRNPAGSHCTYRPHVRMHDTKPNDFPIEELTHTHTSDHNFETFKRLLSNSK